MRINKNFSENEIAYYEKSRIEIHALHRIESKERVREVVIVESKVTGLTQRKLVNCRIQAE